MAYLGYRAPLPVWSSPGIIMPPQDFGNSEENMLKFTSRLVEAVIEYKDLLDQGLVPVEMSGKSPMDMIQYYRLFGANRNPGPDKDSQKIIPDSDRFLVSSNGNVSI